MYTIYLITNLVNGKVYVGQTRTGIERRWKAHKDDARLTKNRPICAAIRKYGPESFDIQEIASCDTQEWTDYLEKVWILLYDSRNRKKGYNIRPGGNTSPMDETTKHLLSKATSKAWSEDRLRGYPHTQETKDKISQIQRGGGFSKKKHIRTEELVFLWNSGVSILELANYFHITLPTVYERIKSSELEYREFSCSKNRSKNNHRRNIPLDLDEIVRLRSEGIPFDKIAAKMNCTPCTIRRRLKKHKEAIQ